MPKSNQTLVHLSMSIQSYVNQERGSAMIRRFMPSQGDLINMSDPFENYYPIQEVRSSQAEFVGQQLIEQFVSTELD